MFAFRSIKPSGYPIPTDGPVGDLLTALKRHPFRPAHLHALIAQAFAAAAAVTGSSEAP